MKLTSILLLVFTAIIGLMHTSCTNPAVLKIATPAVQTQVIGDLEKALIAGGGALLVTNGDTGAAIKAISAQEAANLPGLQKTLLDATPATTSGGTIPVIFPPPATQASAGDKPVTP